MLLSKLLYDFQPFLISHELFQKMESISIDEYVKQDSNRGTEYLSWSIAYHLLVENSSALSNLTPVTLLTDTYLPMHTIPLTELSLPDATGIVDSVPCGAFVCTTLVDYENKRYTGLVWQPVMQKNKMNNAVLIPNSREVSDAVQRSIVKSIAIGTGIGFVLYSQFEFDSTEPSKNRTPKSGSTSFRSNPTPTRTTRNVEPDDEYENDELDEEEYEGEDEQQYEDLPRATNRTRPNPASRFNSSLRNRVK